LGPYWIILAHSESLTRRKLPKKEIPGLYVQNRRMVLAMGTAFQTFCERAQLSLVIGLFAACAANVVLVLAFL
jgi:hypothetical protein